MQYLKNRRIFQGFIFNISMILFINYQHNLFIILKNLMLYTVNHQVR